MLVDVLEIEHFLAVAESVLGIDADRLARVTKIPPSPSTWGRSSNGRAAVFQAVCA
jgi:hypothetical protein